MMEIYITCLLQILSFSKPFRQFKMKNFLRRPTDGRQYFIIDSPTRIFFISTDLIAVLGTFGIVENIMQKQCTYNVSFGLSIFLLHLVSPVLIFFRFFSINIIEN